MNDPWTRTKGAGGEEVGNAGGRWGAVWMGIKGRKKWDFNSIMNKIHLKNK